MEDETQIINKPPVEGTPESKLWGVSLRGLICLIVVSTVCLMSGFSVTIEEPLYTLVGMIIGYYFGQKNTK